MTYSIRPGLIDDARAIVAHRRAMFHEMGYRDQQALDKMCAAFEPWLALRLQSGEYRAWFALDAEGSIVAGLGLWLMDWPPHLIGPGARRGNIVNVYTEPRARRLGLARRLMQTALAWCHDNGIRAVILHASPDGRRLYESLGFKPTNEMRLEID